MYLLVDNLLGAGEQAVYLGHQRGIVHQDLGVDVLSDPRNEGQPKKYGRISLRVMQSTHGVSMEGMGAEAHTRTRTKRQKKQDVKGVVISSMKRQHVSCCVPSRADPTKVAWPILRVREENFNFCPFFAPVRCTELMRVFPSHLAVPSGLHLLFCLVQELVMQHLELSVRRRW